MPQRRVCLRDIAQRVGCHFSTVSLALRNHPRLPRATCEKVQETARQMGYVPDPMLASLAHYRNALRPVSYHATLAWITNYPTRSGWSEVPIFRDYFEGARERAAEFGYKVEEFWLRAAGMTPGRATQILRERGISGVIVAPQPEPGMTVELGWENFSAVTIGFSLVQPRLHLVCPHQFSAIKLAMRELAARAYRRPGLVLLRASDDRVDQNWQAGFLVAQDLFPDERRVPPLLLPRWDEAAFAQWLKRHRPDVILTKFTEIPTALRRLRIAVPKQVGVAFLTHAKPGEALAGLYENPAEVGAAAVEYLTGMIHRNERGVPKLPRRLLIDGSWIDGRTVRARQVPMPAPA
jgi:LacI family transcriptional regulator